MRGSLEARTEISVWEKERLYSGLGGHRQPVGVWSPEAPPFLRLPLDKRLPTPHSWLSQADSIIPEAGEGVTSLMLVCVF